MTNFEYLISLDVDDFVGAVVGMCKEFGGDTALIKEFLMDTHPDVYSVGDYLDYVCVNQEEEDTLVSFVVDGRVYESSGGREGFLDLYGKIEAARVLESYVVVRKRVGRSGRITLDVRKK